MIGSPLALAQCSAHSVGRAFERGVRQVRSYLLPSHIRTYREMLRCAALPDDPGRQFAFYDFSSVDIDLVSGRYVFALVREFEALGFLTCYRRNFRFLATMRHKAHKRLLLERPFQVCSSIHDLPDGSLAVEVTDRTTGKDTIHRQVQIRYDRTWPRARYEFPMGFFAHPLIYEQWLGASAPDLDAPREWSVFFAGRSADREYRSRTLPDRFGKMSRSEIIETLAHRLPRQNYRRAQTAAELAPGASPRKCFLCVDSAECRIPPEGWLSTLDRADFFLACPGMDMPLCHNLVEAMSRAAIPILEHPEYLDPPLEDGFNCLVFRGPDHLVEVMTRALELQSGPIRRLRRNVDAYYRERLAPGRFGRRLMEANDRRCVVLMNACRTPKEMDSRSHDLH